ncbi:MAG: 2OG-Fe(II) oxygenase [Woeseiaceae bacterium]
MLTVGERVAELDWAGVRDNLDADGYALSKAVLSSAECASINRLYDSPETDFRSRIDMARYNFGKGEYKYFDYPLPETVNGLRDALYPPLAEIANTWSTKLGTDVRWPGTLSAFIDQCHAAGQLRPTPLILRYGEGDYNCLHQDLYGDVYFPLQVVCMLSEPAHDFDGGELVLVEQRPRMQSRPMVLSLAQGDIAIIPVRERPRQGTRGFHRVQMRHGVSVLRRGHRATLGIIFHDAR